MTKLHIFPYTITTHPICEKQLKVKEVKLSKNHYQMSRKTISFVSDFMNLNQPKYGGFVQTKYSHRAFMMAICFWEAIFSYKSYHLSDCYRLYISCKINIEMSITLSNRYETITLFPKRNTTFLKLPFFWGGV